MGFISDIFNRPSQPNYSELGREQANLNEQTALRMAKINRPDRVDPFSATTFRQTGPDQFLQTTQLAPEYESLRQREAGLQSGLLDAGQAALGGLPNTPFNLEGIGYQLPDATGLDQFATTASDNFFNRQTARLLPEFDRQEVALRDRLINQGIPEGSDAFNTELSLFNQRKNDALADLSSQAVFQGQNLQSQILGNLLQGRQQQIAERQLTRRQPFEELSLALTGTTPFSSQASAMPQAGSPGVSFAPPNLANLANLQQQSELGRQQGALSPFVNLGAAYLGRGV